MQSEVGNGFSTVRRGPPAALWLIGISLAVIAVCMVLRFEAVGTEAFAQPVSHAGARGVFAFTGQLSKNSYGVFMVDVDAMTVWCYEYVSGKNELKLVAGRSWIFDRYLEDFNCAEPSPAAIEHYVEQAREAKLRNRGNP